jgi:hypothetical protein
MSRPLKNNVIKRNSENSPSIFTTADKSTPAQSPVCRDRRELVGGRGRKTNLLDNK